MELRQYLDILKRHRWFLVEAVVLVGLAAGVLAALRTPVYESSARVLLRPNDPAEQLDPGAGPRGASGDPNRYVAAQRDIAESEPVAVGAAKALKGLNAGQVMSRSSAHQRGASDVMEITGRDVDPVRARDVANEVARSYIENRRLSAVAGLDKAIEDIEDRLTDLQNRIAELDRRIAANPSSSGSSLNRPGSPAQPPTNPTSSPTGTGLDAGGQPSGQASLEAARYAAAVQYESLFARQQDLLVEKNLKRGEAEMISLAETPRSPVSPKPVRDGILGAVVGLLLAAGISFLREQLDERVRTTVEIEKATGLPVLAEIPFDEEVAKTPAVLSVGVRPQGGLSEAMRSLRTSVQFMGIDEPIRTLVVTSPGPAEGKSLVAANLAAVYAQAGYRTLLVSADLRRPRLDTLFPGAKSSKGLTGVIADLSRNGSAPGGVAAHLSEAVIESDVANLVVLPAGATPPNPAELLNSRRMGEVLVAVGAAADVVVIDTPPVLAVTDATVLAARADGVVLVAALGETHRDAARRAVEILEAAKARVLGVVVNKAEPSRRGYTGYYGYVDAPPKRGRGRGRAKPQDVVEVVNGEAIPVTPGHGNQRPQKQAPASGGEADPPREARPTRLQSAPASSGFISRMRGRSPGDRR